MCHFLSPAGACHVRLYLHPDARPRHSTWHDRRIRARRRYLRRHLRVRARCAPRPRRVPCPRNLPPFRLFLRGFHLSQRPHVPQERAVAQNRRHEASRQFARCVPTAPRPDTVAAPPAPLRVLLCVLAIERMDITLAHRRQRYPLLGSTKQVAEVSAQIPHTPHTHPCSCAVRGSSCRVRD